MPTARALLFRPAQVPTLIRDPSIRLAGAPRAPAGAGGEPAVGECGAFDSRHTFAMELDSVQGTAAFERITVDERNTVGDDYLFETC